MSIEQIIARQEKEFNEKYSNFDLKSITTYQDKVYSAKEILWNFHSSSIKEILEGELQRLKEMRMSYLKSDEGTSYAHYGRGYNQCISDTINHLEEIIKKL